MQRDSVYSCLYQSSIIVVYCMMYLVCKYFGDIHDKFMIILTVIHIYIGVLKLKK